MSKAPVIYDKAMHEARKYWRDRLDAASFDGHIALDHPRPKDGDQQLAAFEQNLDDAVHALLRRVTAGNQFLAYTALVLGLELACSQYSGESRVTVFSPATPDGGGPNVLPISTALDPDASFKDALLATKELLSGAYRNQQYPFARMLHDVPDNHRPQHLFMLASMAGFNDAAADQRFDVAVRFETSDAATKAVFRFDNRLYDEATVRHFFALVNAMLRQGFSRMAGRIGDLRPDSASAADQAPRASALAGRDDTYIHRLIEAQAAEHPQHTAVVEGDRITTYDTLNRDADRLAASLAELALDARKPVVVALDAGTAAIVSMLAVLKTGAPFAPVDLAAAGGRLAEILETLDAQCVICRPEDAAAFDAAHVVTVAYAPPAGGGAAPSLEIVRSRGSAAPDAHDSRRNGSVDGDAHSGTACVLAAAVRDDNVSAAAVSHAALAALFQWLNARFGIGADDRCLLLRGAGACDRLYGTLGMLIAGAGVEAGDASLLTAAGITVWVLPTPVAQNVLAALLPLAAERTSSPRTILLTGEKQSVHVAQRLAQTFPDARIAGLYASPAVGLWSTLFPLAHGAPNTSEPPVAEPIPGFEHRILNRHGAPVPSYAKGELHVDGAKTGLRAQPLEGGRMRWLRGDDHRFVKAGCSVELTNVEAVLCQHERVLAAEVFAVKPGRRRDELVVAFVLADSNEVTAEAARDFLVLHDGADLVPDRFVVLDGFPVTADGAIDRAGLMASHGAHDEARSAELDKIHQQLKSIWVEILQLDDVDDDASFFAQGGNSLKATLLIARIRDDFGVDLSVQDFFRKPSVRAVAELIDAAVMDAENAEPRQKAPDFKAVSRDKYRVQLAEIER